MDTTKHNDADILKSKVQKLERALEEFKVFHKDQLKKNEDQYYGRDLQVVSRTESRLDVYKGGLFIVATPFEQLSQEEFLTILGLAENMVKAKLEVARAEYKAL